MLRDKQGLTEQEFLEAYRPGDYPCPSLTVDMVLFTVAGEETDNYRKLPEQELRVLLVRRGGHPFLGSWALPGGFVKPEETVGEAAVRELREETGVNGVYLEQLYTFSAPDRDPRTWVVSSAHMALVGCSHLQVVGGDDADEAAWFWLSCQPVSSSPNRYRLTLEHGDTHLEAVVETGDYPEQAEAYRVVENVGLAFDHAKILLCALLRLRGKVEYTPIALHLVPEQFTLTQLQQVYEVILGRPLLKAAFRRKIAHLVDETETFTQNAGHRPSRLFRRKPGKGEEEEG